MSWSFSGEAAEAYANLIFYRTRDGMLIDDWQVDWEKAPFTHSFYDTDKVFPVELPTSESSVSTGAVSSADYIASLLYSVYGFAGLRLVINCNDQREVYTKFGEVKYGRHTASGGGRYCVDFYLVESGSKDNSTLPAGVYHYSPLRHVWEQLYQADVTDLVAVLQDYELVCERYLIMTIDYWRSGFKYNDFAYQASAMDIGTVIGSIHEIVGERTVGSWDMWVNEKALAKLLGLDPQRVGIYVVQGWGSERPRADEVSFSLPQIPSRVSFIDSQVSDFETTVALQKSMEEYPKRSELFLPIPVPNSVSEPSDSSWWQVLHRRQSSFGRFTGESYSKDVLLSLLRAGDDACEQLIYKSADTSLSSSLSVRWEYLVYVTNINGLMPGIYRYQPNRKELELIVDGQYSDFLVNTYFLRNYDGRKSAATMILCGNVFECSKQWGVRGYRYINAIIGASCQAICVEATRHKIGTGIALGFDAQAHAEKVGLEKNKISPMLMIMTGIDNQYAGEFHTDSSLFINSGGML